MLEWIYDFKSNSADLAIRRAIEQSASLIPSGTYRRFCFYNPRVCGVLEGYDVRFGASIDRYKGSSISVYLFEKIKLKHPPRVSWKQKDCMVLNVSDEKLRLEWGCWLTRIHRIPRTSPSETTSQVNQMLKESTLNNINCLIEIARQIDSGSYNLTSQISEKKSQSFREFLLTMLAIIGAIAFWWLVFPYLDSFGLTTHRKMRGGSVPNSLKQYMQPQQGLRPAGSGSKP
jgi:hypothetical protein